jgi:hypothetical protein
MTTRPRFRRSLTAIALGALTVAGCFGSTSQRPPRNAESLSPTRLAGLWEGTYRARTVERDGRFRISFEQRGDSVTGWLELLGVAMAQLRSPLGVTTPSAADIIRVELESVALDGVAARMRSVSYRDPGCGCALTLHLTGFVVADTIGGYFDAIGTAVTVPERGGRWRAVRVR